MSNQSAGNNDNDSKAQISMFLDMASKFLIPLVVALVTWQQSVITKLEDRVYVIQREAVSETKLQQTETRILSYVDTRLNDLGNKVDLSNQYLHLLLQSQKGEK